MGTSKFVVLGTAGHVDHGKTTLIKTLTGIDPDRLKEEKEREMTIDLGFAYLDLPNGTRIGIVDVPGHEKFIRNMVAGAQGVDLIALVIAADEGIMPQTREHLHICQLLGIKKGFVVLNKIDLVEKEFLELVKEEVSELLKGTFLEGAPIVEVSSVTKEGFGELLNVIEKLVQEVQEKPRDGLFRLPIDRAFSIRGFGTVVTGTVIAGEITLGEEVEILPSGSRGKIRSIQVHKERVERAFAGQRAALNLLGVDKESVERGDVVVQVGTFITTQALDVQLEMLPKAPVLKNGMTLNLHIGTSHVTARVLVIGQEKIGPGERGLAQLRLNRPIVAAPFDRFILRGSGNIQTWGGGIVIDAHPSHHKRFDPYVIKELSQLRTMSPEGLLLYQLKKNPLEGMDIKEIMARTGLTSSTVLEIVDSLINKGELTFLEGHYFLSEALKGLKDKVLENISHFHKHNPLKAGIPKEELRKKIGSPKMSLFEKALEELIKEGKIEREGEIYKLKGYRPLVDEGLLKAIEGTFLRAGLTPPTFKEFVQSFNLNPSKAKELLTLLVAEGKLVKVKEELYFHAKPLEDLKQKLIEFLETNKKITLQEFKNLASVSRKYLVPLAEYFDSIKVTIRIGDERMLRRN